MKPAYLIAKNPIAPATNIRNTYKELKLARLKIKNGITFILEIPIRNWNISTNSISNTVL